MSVNIKVRNALKKYGENVIIPDLSLDIKEGEFFTLLGPSGCGKTTLLRMIAGFNTIEGGDFYFNDKRINDMDPAKRNIGMVFQNYAIFPNMTVEKNVAFGLNNRKLDKATISKQTDRFLKLMQIDEYRDRMPERLSGGQQQRVALARALAITPDVLLMDEPLSNLDAKLRVEMRTVIKNIQRDVGITTVYVTHDQEEAMAVSNRIAVMNHGVIQQIGTPKDLYQRPANQFVATFIGRTNIVKGKLERKDDLDYIILGGKHRYLISSLNDKARFNEEVLVSIRPEEFVVNEKDNGGLRGRIKDSIFLGLNTHYYLELDSGDEVEVIQESKIDSIIPAGTEVYLSIKTEKINIFSKDGNTSFVTGVKNDMDLVRRD